MPTSEELAFSCIYNGATNAAMHYIKETGFNIENEKGKDYLDAAINNNNPDLVLFIIENSEVDVNRIKEGYTPLQHAVFRAEQNDYSVIEILLEKGADVNKKANDLSMSPLYISISNRDTELVKYLIDKGADVNEVINSKGDTILHQAVRSFDDVSVIEKIIDAGADINKKNIFENTPIDIASKIENIKVEELLKDCKNEKGENESIEEKQSTTST